MLYFLIMCNDFYHHVDWRGKTLHTKPKAQGYKLVSDLKQTCLHNLDAEACVHSVVFLHMRRIQKLDMCSPILEEHIVFLSKNEKIGYVLLI